MTTAPSAAPVVVRLYVDTTDAPAIPAAWRERFEVVESAGVPAAESGFYLWAGGGHVELRHGGRDGGAWVTLAELDRRTARGSDLLRACGVSAAHRPDVLDVMGGWGVDALVLAARGCAVTVVERLPALWLLQEDLIRRRGARGVRALCGDGFDYLRQAPAPAVVYLDPMFPERAKTALPGKRMQWLAELAQEDPRPLAQWLELARGRVRERVVVKRRRRDPVVCSPDWQITGRTVRYDVYRPGDAQSS